VCKKCGVRVANPFVSILHDFASARINRAGKALPRQSRTRRFALIAAIAET
jgi:hypothetical protein